MFDIKHLLFLAPLASVAFADLELEREDVPPPCRDICQPIVDLTQRCQVDLRGDNNDRQEDLLERQCVCTNDSFDVERIAGLCASCFQQNFRTPDDDNDSDDDDDNNTEWDDDDIQEIIRDCGFGTAVYSSQLSTAAQTINVVATAPTASDQLTTTIDRNSNNNNPQPTNSNNDDNNNSNNNNNNDDDDDSSSNNSNNNDSPSTSNGGNSADQTSNDNPDETDFAVPGAVPLAGFSAAAVLGAFGALAAGGAFLL